MTIDRIAGGPGTWPAPATAGTSPAAARPTAASPIADAGDDSESSSTTVTLSAASLTFSGDEIPALSELLYEDEAGSEPTEADGAAESDVLSQVVNRYAAFSAAPSSDPGLDVDA